jgi:hypothetical protein
MRAALCARSLLITPAACAALQHSKGFQMKKARLLGAAMAACFVAATGGAQAASVTLTGWAFGQGHVVTGSMGGTAINAWAGGFGGTLADAGRFDSASFLTYCIELEESFGFSSTPMTGYALVEGASYFEARRQANPLRPDGALVADRLGRLLTFVADNPTSVDTAIESSAMQLAIWNIVYDGDVQFAASSSSLFSASNKTSEKFGLRTQALLDGAAGVASSRFTVYALSRSGTQDFIVAEPNNVPEPASALLSAIALGGLALSRRAARAAPARRA